jgi:hypothetical protein
MPRLRGLVGISFQSALAGAPALSNFGRASAQMILNRVHTIRGPNAGTGTHSARAPP